MPKNGQLANEEQDLKTYFEKQKIAEVVSNWAFWRDRREWEKMKACFHDDATTTTFFYSGDVDGFINIAKKTLPPTFHIVCNSLIEVNNNKATSESNYIISVIDVFNGYEARITLYCRQFDFLELRDHTGWRIKKRVTIYDSDQLDLINPGPLSWFYYPKKQLSLYPYACKYVCYQLVSKFGPKAIDISKITTKDSPSESAIRDEASIWLGGNSYEQ